MNGRLLVTASLSAAMLHGAALTVVTAEQSASRTLTVQQAAIKDVTPPVTQMPDDTAGFDVLAWVDRADSTYARGQNVRMFVQTSKDAYVTVLNVDPAGETTVLFPNRYQSDNKVYANRPIEVPDPESGAKVMVTGTVGTELIKVIASSKPIPLFEATQVSEAGPFGSVRTRAAGTARSLVIAMEEPGGATPELVAKGVQLGAEWAMCHQTIATIDQPSPALQRTRSLAVLRTGNDGGSMTCDEAAQ